MWAFLWSRSTWQTIVSSKTKSNASPYILAQWAGMRGIIRGKILWVGRVMYFINHCIIFHEANETYDLHSKWAKSSNLFAEVQWHCSHPRQNWFASPILVVSSTCEVDATGPATFILISRILSQCTVISDRITCDFGEDSILVAIPLKKRIHCVHPRSQL